MEAIKKQVNKDYHLACQHCGTVDKPLHIIPLRNDKHVVGLIHACDDCGEVLKGSKFDRLEADAQSRYVAACDYYDKTHHMGDIGVLQEALRIAAGIKEEK